MRTPAHQSSPGRSLRCVHADLDYTVRRSERARSVRVRVEHDGEVTVTLPRRARDRDAAAAVRELRPWIDRRLAEVDAARAGHPADARDRPRPRPRAAPRRAARAHARAPPRRPAARARPRPRPARRRSSAGTGGPRGPRPPPRSTPRRRRSAGRTRSSRSASSARAGARARRRGAIAINWRLVLGPPGAPGVRRLARGVPPRRARPLPRFWGLLGSHLPGYEEPRRWLRDNGAALQL